MKINFAYSNSSEQESLKEVWMKNEPAECELQVEDKKEFKRLKAVRLDDIFENQIGSIFSVEHVRDDGITEHAVISGSEAFSAWFRLQEEDFTENLPELIEIEVNGSVETLRLNVSNFKYNVREIDGDDFSKPKKTYNLTQALAMCLMRDLKK